MSFTLSSRSLERLKGVDEELVKVVKLALTYSEIDFGVIEGIRTIERQRELFNEGKYTKTMKSKHLIGKAVDLLAYVDEVKSDDPKEYVKISQAMKKAAEELGVAIRWGGDFKTFFDGYHFELV